MDQAARGSAALAALALLLAACGTSNPSPAASSGPPIQIGVIDTISGPFAQIGNDTINGANIAVAQINSDGGVKGSKLQLVIKDEQLKADVTVQAIRELQAANVKIVMGFLSSADCLAGVPIAAQLDMLMVGSNCAAPSLTTTKFDPHFFRIPTNEEMMTKAAAQLAADKFAAITTWDGYYPNYVTGKSYWDGFKTNLKTLQPNVKFGKEVFPSLSATDVRSEVSAMLASAQPTDGLFLATFGASTEVLVKQGKPLDFFKRFKAVINVGGSEPTAKALGADFPDVFFVYDYYHTAFQNAVNTRFVSEYKKKYTDPPDAWAYEGFASIYALKAGIEKAGGTNVPALIKAMEGLKFDSPKGQIFFRKEDHQAVTPVAVFECKGDAAAPQGFTCPFSTSIAPDKVLSPPNVSR